MYSNTPLWKTIIYYLLIWPIIKLVGFLLRNIKLGISRFIQNTTATILGILIGSGIIGWVAILHNT